MPHHWIPNSANGLRRKMLNELGVEGVDELFKDIPESLRLKERIKVGFGRPLTEFEAVKLFNKLMSKNRFKGVEDLSRMFLGGGVCPHYIPSAVKEIVSRSEFYSAYTPYQPEINQGLLQAFFEYQSIMAELYGVDVVNASMYNGSTAAAEAVRMALRVRRGRRSVVIASNTHPEVREVISTWLQGVNAKVVEVGFGSDGRVDVEDLKRKVGEDTAAIYVETPNFFGVIEEGIKDVIEIAHSRGALAIVGANPISLGALRPPGSLGADIVVGDAQPLGIGLNFGGPSAGILGVQGRKELIRQLPGRLIGMTTTVDGRERGFMMILQTREQHIRRERATSNITTNSGLEAIAVAVYTSLLGSEGLRKLSLAVLGRTSYLIKEVVRRSGGCVRPAFEDAHYFGEVTLSLNGLPADAVLSRVRGKGFYAGPPLSRFGMAGFEDCTLVCVSEVHARSDIDAFVNALLGSVEEVRVG